MWVRRVCLVCTLAMALGAMALPSAAKPTRPPATQLLLALGDSVPAGVGATDPDSTGYVPRLHDRLRDDLECAPAQAPRCRSLHLANIAVGGATTVSLIQDQLPIAVDLLEERNGDKRATNDVRVVTVTIGGNDVFGPLVEVCTPDPLTPTCIDAITAQSLQVATNLPVILETLAAAGDGPTGGATIAVMTYYNPLGEDNPLGACDLVEFTLLADVVLEGGKIAGVDVPGLNNIIRQAAISNDAVVANTFGALDDDDLVGDCLHPNDSGHHIIADVFADAILHN